MFRLWLQVKLATNGSEAETRAEEDTCQPSEDTNLFRGSCLMYRWHWHEVWVHEQKDNCAGQPDNGGKCKPWD